MDEQIQKLAPMTRLTKPVHRVVAMDANDGRGKRDFVVTLHPDGEVHIRTKGSRRHYSLPFAAIFWHAARAAVEGKGK